MVFDEAPLVRNMALSLMERMRLRAMVDTGDFGPDAVMKKKVVVGCPDEGSADALPSMACRHDQRGGPAEADLAMKQLDRMETDDACQ